MGIPISKVDSITVNTPSLMKISNHDFIDDFIQESYDRTKEVNSEKYNVLTVSKSLIKRRLEDGKIVNTARELISKVCESMVISKRVNESMYSSISLIRLSEGNTEDERNYLSYQHKIIFFDWCDIFYDCYNKTKSLTINPFERISAIMTNREASTFSHEIVSGLNNHLCQNNNGKKKSKKNSPMKVQVQVKSPKNKKILSEKNNKRSNTKGPIKTNFKSSYTRNRNECNGIKTTPFLTSVFSYDSPKVKSLKIDFNKIMIEKDKESTKRNKDKNKEKNTNLFLNTHYNSSSRQTLESQHEDEQLVKKRTPFKRKTASSIIQVNSPRESLKMNYASLSEANQSFSNIFSNNDNDKSICKELMEQISNQPKLIDKSPLNDNTNIINPSQIKRVLNEFKSKNCFLFEDTNDNKCLINSLGQFYQ